MQKQEIEARLSEIMDKVIRKYPESLFFMSTLFIDMSKRACPGLSDGELIAEIMSYLDTPQQGIYPSLKQRLSEDVDASIRQLLVYERFFHQYLDDQKP